MDSEPAGEELLIDDEAVVCEAVDADELKDEDLASDPGSGGSSAVGPEDDDEEDVEEGCSSDGEDGDGGIDTDGEDEAPAEYEVDDDDKEAVEDDDEKISNNDDRVEREDDDGEQAESESKGELEDHTDTDKAEKDSKEGIINEYKERDLNDDKTLGTPNLRRSNRTKQSASPPPGDTPCSVGRTTRSQLNPDIIAKQKSFMHKYQIAVKSPLMEYVRSAAADDASPVKRKWEETTADDPKSSETSPVMEKKSRKSSIGGTPSSKGGHFLDYDGGPSPKRHDTYCWSCHLDGQVVECCKCPRVFHQRCVQQQSPVGCKWLCPECVAVRNADKQPKVGAEQLKKLFRFAMERIKSVTDSDPFFKPVDRLQFPHYGEYIVHPVDLGMLELNIDSGGVYTTTRAFLAEFRWILHNCIVFNSFHSKLTNTARTLMKVCKHEMAEIDTCADCYMHAHTKRDTWFLETCRRPHLLIWAKLKGFPHWPAKAMKANKEGNVDVRFFGAHDRAWVPAKDCFLYSQEMPIQVKNKRKANLDSSVEEVEQHIRKLTDSYGPYVYPAPRTAYNPQKEEEHLLALLPGYKPPEEVRNGSSRRLKMADGFMDTESNHSESEGGEICDPGSVAPADAAAAPAPVTAADSANPTAATTVATSVSAPEDGDRVEDCNFLAMLQLAPRGAVDAAPPSHTSTPTSAANGTGGSTKVVSSNDAEQLVSNSESPTVFKLQGKTYKLIRTSKMRVSEAGQTQKGEKAVKVYIGPGAPPSGSEKTVSRTPLSKSHSKSSASSGGGGGGGESGEGNNNSISNNNNGKKGSVVVKQEPGEESVAAAAHPPGSKSNSMSSVALSIDAVVGNYKDDSVAVKAVSKSSAKAWSKSSNGKGSSARRRAEDEEDLDPAMYLDPTITITLVNNEADRRASMKRVLEEATPSTISSSDLQALNALGENVSITVVPKRRIVPSTTPNSASNSVRSKENDSQAMVIEIDPASVQKGRTSLQAKARKSFPKSSRPQAHQHAQKLGPKTTTTANTNPPMVAIPPSAGRHLGMEVSRSTPRVPSITVRPVSHSTTVQPNIVLQSTSTTATPADPGAAATATTTIKPAPSSANAASELASGSVGLLVAFNRLPTFTAAAPVAPNAAAAPMLTSANSWSAKSTAAADAGPISAQLASRTQQIADMVRNTLETLMQEMGSAGNLDASAVQLGLDLERSRWCHQQEVAELKRSLEAHQASAEADKQRALAELRKQLESDKKRAVDEAKKKQWCAQCGQEAIYYCCWNTAYCDHPCQQSHWPKHMATCANANQNAESAPDSTDAADQVRNLSPQKPSSVAVNGSPVHGRKGGSATSRGGGGTPAAVVAAAARSDLGQSRRSSSSSRSTPVS